MLNPFKQLGDLKAMRDQAMAIQKQLSAEILEVVKGNIRIVITGEQKVQRIERDGQEDREMLEAVNEAIKKSQEVAAKKLSEMSGGLQGLLGGGGQG